MVLWFPDNNVDHMFNKIYSSPVSYNIDKTFNTSLSADGSLYNLGLSSFLNSDNAMAIFNDASPTGANNGELDIQFINMQ